MKTLTTTFLFFCLIILTMSCEDTQKQEEPTTAKVDTVVTKATVAPKVDRKTEIENWKKFIDTNIATTFRIDSFGYQCDGGGGHVKHIKDNGAIRMLSYFNGGEHGHEEIKYYLEESGEIVAIAHEYGTWVMDTDELEQTTFFLEGDKIIHSTNKKVKGKASEIEKMIANAPLREANPKKLEKILTKYNEVAQLDGATIQKHFCDY